MNKETQNKQVTEVQDREEQAEARPEANAQSEVTLSKKQQQILHAACAVGGISSKQKIEMEQLIAQGKSPDLCKGLKPEKAKAVKAAVKAI